MKRLLYTISFLVLFAVPFQAQQSDTASRFDGFDLEQMLDDLTDLELVQDAIQAWLSVDVSGFGVVANRQLASFLEFFLRETGIQVGIRQNIDTENMFWRWIRTRNAKGTFQGGSGEHFVIFNLSFVPQEDDPRQYQITITLERQHSIETSSRVDSVRWGYFNRHIDSLNNSGQTYARDDFRMAVDGLITGGLFVLLGVNSFPLETTIRPLSFQAIDTICTRTQNDQRHVPSYEWIIVGTQRIPIKNVSLRVGDVMPLQIAVNRMEMDTVERTINLSSSRGAFRHEVSSFDSIRDLVFTATTTGEDAIIATHEMQIGERRIVETAGQLNISVFNELSNRVVIVPVHGTEPTNQRVGNLNQRELQDFLNAVFGQAVARWDVTVDEPLRVNNFNGRLRTETGVFSNYSPDMNTIISAHRNSRTVDRNTYYIFIVPQFERPEVIGFMPMRRQFGFVSFHSTDSEVLGRTIAHELGHGAFRLEHIFSAFPGVGQGRTNNLMDYASDGGGRTPLCVSRLYRFQWEQIHDPRRGLFLFQEEEDIMARIDRRREIVRQTIEALRFGYAFNRTVTVNPGNPGVMINNIVLGDNNEYELIIVRSNQNRSIDINPRAVSISSNFCCVGGRTDGSIFGFKQVEGGRRVPTLHAVEIETSRRNNQHQNLQTHIFPENRDAWLTSINNMLARGNLRNLNALPDEALLEITNEQRVRLLDRIAEANISDFHPLAVRIMENVPKEEAIAKDLFSRLSESDVFISFRRAMSFGTHKQFVDAALNVFHNQGEEHIKERLRNTPPENALVWRRIGGLAGAVNDIEHTITVVGSSLRIEGNSRKVVQSGSHPAVIPVRLYETKVNMTDLLSVRIDTDTRTLTRDARAFPIPAFYFDWMNRYSDRAETRQAIQNFVTAGSLFLGVGALRGAVMAGRFGYALYLSAGIGLNIYDLARMHTDLSRYVREEIKRDEDIRDVFGFLDFLSSSYDISNVVVSRIIEGRINLFAAFVAAWELSKNRLYEEVRRNSNTLTAEEIIVSMQRLVDEINVELSKR